MDPRLRGICTSILECDGVRNDVKSIVWDCLKQDDLAENAGNSWEPSMEQMRSLKHAESTYILHRSRFRFKPQLTFEHTAVHREDTGFYVTLKGIQITRNVSRKEGSAIARFISDMYDEIKDIIEADKPKKKKKLPF